MNDIVLLNLRISMWGVSRVLPENDFEVDANKAMVRATKKILECPEYEFLLQLKRSIHRRLKTLALSGEILRAGVYPVSVAMVEAVERGGLASPDTFEGGSLARFPAPYAILQ